MRGPGEGGNAAPRRAGAAARRERSVPRRGPAAGPGGRPGRSRRGGQRAPAPARPSAGGGIPSAGVGLSGGPLGGAGGVAGQRPLPAGVGAVRPAEPRAVCAHPLYRVLFRVTEERKVPRGEFTPRPGRSCRGGSRCRRLLPLPRVWSWEPPAGRRVPSSPFPAPLVQLLLSPKPTQKPVPGRGHQGSARGGGA